jgi:hypothetical protein
MKSHLTIRGNNFTFACIPISLKTKLFRRHGYGPTEFPKQVVVQVSSDKGFNSHSGLDIQKSKPYSQLLRQTPDVFSYVSLPRRRVATN